MSKDLVTIDSFLPFKEDAAKIQALAEMNLGDISNISAYELPRIKMPGAGGTTWSLPGLTGDRAEKKLVSIILAWKPIRAYWPGEFAGNMPPQCSSADAIFGVGDPGGVCEDCPLSKWKTGKNGRGQACTAKVRMLPLEAGGVLPMILAIPPTSLKAWRVHGTNMLNASVPYWAVVTEIGLKEDKNQEGIAFSRATFEAQTVIEGEQREQLEGYAKGFQQMLARLAVQADDYSTDGVDLEGLESGVGRARGNPLSFLARR